MLALACPGKSRHAWRAGLGVVSALACLCLAAAEPEVVPLAAGMSHACALTAAGGVKCWGLNEGRLGDGTSTRRYSPVNVIGLDQGVVAVTAGDQHSCALTTWGGVKCWGINYWGQLGDGSRVNRLEPVDVVGLSSGVQAISAGATHTCALAGGGRTMCWGDNRDGQLGDGTQSVSPRLVPGDVQGLSSETVAIGAGGSRTCALGRDGSVSCWPRKVSVWECMPANCCFLIYCTPCPWQPTCNWLIRDRFDPGVVSGMNSGIRAIAMSTESFDSLMCAVTASGGVTCQRPSWGSATALAQPTSGVTAITIGIGHACVLGAGGVVGCRGGNYYGELGPQTPPSGTVSDIPIPVEGLPAGIQALAAGDNFTCAMTSAGDVYCWGDNREGQLGDGTSVGRSAPARVIGFGAPAVAMPGVLTGLWWNPLEPGWGVHVTQRDDVAFVAWFTYDGAGRPKWYVASRCAFSGLTCPTCVASSACSGSLYETGGPSYFGVPFDASAVRVFPAGSLQLAFRDADNATLSLVLQGVSRVVPVTRQVFGSGETGAPNYSDLWWSAAEPGWGLAVTQRGNVMFLAWFVYDRTGSPEWYLASSCAMTASGNGCAGTLYRASGPPFGPAFDASRVQVTPLGNVNLVFSGPNFGTLTYTVDGVTGSKAITRQLF